MKRNRYERNVGKGYAMKTLAVAVASLLAGAAGAQTIPANTLPTAGSVAPSNGTAAISQSGAAMTIQTSQRAIIDWASFNIGSGASVTFQQPGATSVAVNRVGASAGQSVIDGTLNANGHVMLLNPNGVMFNSSASVNVGGLIASTGNINDTQFMSSPTAPIAITGATTGIVSNQGRITVTDAGLAAFVAPSVSNSGTITATSGRIVLANAEETTISLNGNSLYEIVVTKGFANGTISNTGTLSAIGAGGSIVLSALDAANLVSGAINLAGIQQANTIVVNGGTVELRSSLQASSVSGNSSIVNVHSGGGRVQDGVNVATSGGAVNVAAGTYAEQLSITKSLTLAGAGAGQSIIAPTSLAADTSALQNILTIGGSPANNVEVSGFTIQGPVPNINYGIFVRDGAHATIHDNSVINIRFDPLSGVQQGVAIRVGSAALNTSGTAVIENNVITGYQKGGIVVDGPGTQATVTGNTVTGAGPTGVTAQNGIQISRGASATVTGNTVSGNFYTGNDEATGILIFTPGANLGQGSITVGPNTVTNNQVGMYTNDPNTLATISLTGISGNTRNAEADFTGGFANGGIFLAYPAWSASNAALVNATAFTGTQSGDIVDTGGALRVSGWSGFTAIQPAINAVASGGTVNVAAGTYTQSTTLNVNKSLTLAGAGEAHTTIDTRTVSGYGMLVNVDNVSLSGFTLYGPTANSASSYGIKVQPAGSAPSSRLNNFSITNVTSRGAFKAELDLNGVNGAVIDHVTANGAPVGNDAGSTAGAGIQITDSANVTLSNSTTLNNQWGGVALFQSNRFFDQQTTNITVQGNNSLTESLPLYMQDESTSLNFGALNLLGFNYAARNSGSVGNSQFTWLQYTLPNAIDFAVNVPTPASSTVQGWSGTGTTQNFEVGVGNLLGGGTQAMSIATAINTSGGGANIHVGAGTYAENVTVNGLRNLTFDGSTIHGLTLNSGASGSGIGGSVTADTAAGFSFNTPVVLLANTTLDTSAASGAVTTGAINGTVAGAQALTINAGSGAVSLGDLGASTRLGATDVTGTISLTSSIYAANSFHLTGPTTLTQATTSLSTSGGGITLDGATNGTVAGAQALTINAGSSAVSLGDLGANTRLGATDVTGAISLTGATYAANSLHLTGPTTLTQATTSLSTNGGSIALDGATNGTVTGAQALTINAGSGAVSLGDLGAQTRLGATDVSGGTLNFTGSTYAANSLLLTGPLTLTQPNTALDTSVTGGAVMTGAIDGTAAGAQALTINAGSGAVSLGDLGANTRLGATDVTGGTLNFTGSIYAANSLHLTGPVTLTQATTSFSTNGGGITLDGAINGTVAGAQALTINAGSGAVSLGDLGANTRLGATDVTGTISLSGSSYTANSLQLTRSTTLTQATTSLTTNGGGITLSGAINGTAAGAQDLTINAGSGAVSLGDLGANARLGAADVTGTISLTGATYAANSLHFAGPATLTHNTVLDTSAASGPVITGAINGTSAGAQALTINAGSGAVSLGDLGAQTRLGAADVTGTISLTGAAYAANSLRFAGPATLTHNTVLDTSAASGPVITGAINGTAAGAQALTINAGSGAVSLGNLGVQTRLGATNVTGGTINFTGSTYAANSLLFTGPATLTQAETTFSTSGGNITFNGDVQNADASSHALTLMAGSGDVSLISGGSQSNPLGEFDVASNNFTLLGTLWVAGYKIDAAGNIALSNHTLRAVGTNTTSTISAGGDVTGSTISGGSVQVTGGGDVAANVTAKGDATVNGNNVSGNIAGNNVAVAAQNNANANVTARGDATVGGNNVSGSIAGNNVAVAAQNNESANVVAQSNAAVNGNNVSGSIAGNNVVVAAQNNVNANVNAVNTASLSGDSVSGTVTASSAGIVAGSDVQVTLNTNTTVVHAGGNANLTGSSSSVTVDASSGSASGNFGQINNIGSGLIDVNGAPKTNTTLSANAENNRVIPSETAISGNTAGISGRGQTGMPSDQDAVQVARSAPAGAGEFLERGQSVEIDLSPANDHEKKQRRR